MYQLAPGRRGAEARPREALGDRGGMVRVVTALSGLVLIVLALRLAMAPLFPLDKFVAPAMTSFEAETGTVVKYGSADLTLLPTPSVVADDVSIELPDGLGSVHADRLSLALDPFPFLSGSAEIGSVAVERPVLSLSLKGGDLDPARVVGTLASLASRAASQHFLATDGRLVISVGSWKTSLDGFTTSATRADSGDRLVFKTGLHDTPLSLVIEAGAAGATRAHFATPALSVGLDGGLAGGAFAGRLDLAVSDAAALGDAFAAISGPLQLNGAVTLSSGRAEMMDASTTVLGGSGRLSAALDLGAPRVSVDLHADFGRLPVDSLTTLGTLAARLGFDPVGGRAPFDIGIDLKLAELPIAGGEMRNVRFTAVDRGTRFGVLFDAIAGKGTLSSRLDLVPEGDGRRLGASFALKGIEFRDLASWAGRAASPVGGRLDADLHLSAHGRSRDELAATLAVDGDGQLRDGRLDALQVIDGVTLPAMEALSADLSIVGFDKPARLTGQANTSSGAVTVEMEAAPRQLVEGGAAPVKVRLNGPLLSLGFDGGFDPSALAADGSLTLASRQLPTLAGFAGLPAEASLDGKLEASAGRLTVSDAHLVVGEGTFDGLLEVLTGGERRRFNGRLTGDAVDVAAMAHVIGEALTGDERHLAAATDADLRIEAERIAAGPIVAAGGFVDLRLAGAEAEIGIPRLSLGGGLGSATLTIKGGERPTYAIKGELENARLASLAPLVGTVADGKLDLKADVNVEGKTREDLFKSMIGNADFSVTHGTLDGLDPMALIGRLARSVQAGFGSDEGRFGFDRLSGRVKLAAGVATSNDLAFASGGLELTGGGSLGLERDALDLRLRPKVQDYPEFEVPVAVVGPFRSPRLYPDLPGLPDDPASGYVQLATMAGGFARLIGDEAPPKLDVIEPDAMTSIIGKLAATPKPSEETASDAPLPVVPPLPLARPTGRVPVPGGQQAARPPVLVSGPLDLGALGRSSAGAAPTNARSPSCRPGRDGRCIP